MILFFVLLACLLIYYMDRLQEEAGIIAHYSTITNINILETDTWFWLLVAGLVIAPLPLMFIAAAYDVLQPEHQDFLELCEVNPAFHPTFAGYVLRGQRHTLKGFDSLHRVMSSVMQARLRAARSAGRGECMHVHALRPHDGTAVLRCSPAPFTCRTARRA